MHPKFYRFYIKPHNDRWAVFDREENNRLAEVCLHRSDARAAAKRLNATAVPPGESTPQSGARA